LAVGTERKIFAVAHDAGLVVDGGRGMNHGQILSGAVEHVECGFLDTPCTEKTET
jgi:hypothetical protein